MGCLRTHGLRTSSDTRLQGALAYQEKRRPFVTTGDAVGCRSTLLFSLVLRVLQGGERARQYLFRLQQVKRRDVKSIVGKKRFYPDARIPVATASSGCASLAASLGEHGYHRKLAKTHMAGLARAGVSEPCPSPEELLG